MFCPKCGTQVSDRVRFCPKCGTRLVVRRQDSVPPDPVTDDAPSCGHPVIWVLMVVEAVISGLLALDLLIRLIVEYDGVADLLSLYRSSSAAFGTLAYTMGGFILFGIICGLCIASVNSIYFHGERASKERARAIANGLCALGIVFLFGEDVVGFVMRKLLSSSDRLAGPMLIVISHFSDWAEEQSGFLLVAGIIPLVAGALSGGIGKKFAQKIS